MNVRQWKAIAFGCVLAAAAHGQQSQIPSEEKQREVRTITQKRIEDATRRFHEHTTAFPNQNVSVTASFKNGMDIREAVHAAQQHGLRVEGFRHGDISQSGGYTMVPGESVEEAIRQYEYDIEYFTRVDLENTEQMLRSAPDDITQQALNIRKQEILRRQQQFAKEGLKILGLDLHGSATSLDRFAATQPFVRVMELREGGRRNAAVLPTD